MFGTDTVMRWPSQAEMEAPLPQVPSLSSIFIAAYIKSKSWGPAVPEAEGPPGCGMLWKLFLTDLRLMKIFALLDTNKSLLAEFVIRKCFKSSALRPPQSLISLVLC